MGHNEKRCSRTKRIPSKFNLMSIKIGLTYFQQHGKNVMDTSFSGSLKVEKHDDKLYCPVKDANVESPNAVCKMCIAEQLEF